MPLLRESADVNLTRQQIEGWIQNNGAMSPNEFRALCDLALRGLASETKVHPDTTRLNWLVGALLTGELSDATGMEFYDVKLERRPEVARAAIDAKMAKEDSRG